MKRKKEQEPVTIINVMADGTVCRTLDELAAYLAGKELPLVTRRLMADFVLAGCKSEE